MHRALQSLSEYAQEVHYVAACKYRARLPNVGRDAPPICGQQSTAHRALPRRPPYRQRHEMPTLYFHARLERLPDGLKRRFESQVLREQKFDS